jgi:hypothetical protein
MTADGPLLIGYGSDGARQAIREAAELLGGRKALVATAWEPAIAYGGSAMPGGMELQPTPSDIGATQELGQELEAHARRTAEEGRSWRGPPGSRRSRCASPRKWTSPKPWSRWHVSGEQRQSSLARGG